MLTDAYSATSHRLRETILPNDLKGIRAANQFMKTPEKVLLVMLKKQVMIIICMTRNMAEARLLQAIFHFDLAGWFGDIPVIGNENGVLSFLKRGMLRP